MAAQCVDRRIMNYSFEHPANVIGRYMTHGLENRLEISVGGEQIEVSWFCPVRTMPVMRLVRQRWPWLPASLIAVRDGLNTFEGIASFAASFGLERCCPA